MQLSLTHSLSFLQVGAPGLGKTTFMQMLQQQVSSVSEPYEEDEQACLLKQRAEASPGEYLDIQAKLEQHFVANPAAFSCVLEHVDGPFSYTYTLQVRPVGLLSGLVCLPWPEMFTGTAAGRQHRCRHRPYKLHLQHAGEASRVVSKVVFLGCSPASTAVHGPTSPPH